MTNISQLSGATAPVGHDIMQQANAAWVRTLAVSEHRITEQGISDYPGKSESVHTIRAQADLDALWSRYHDPLCHEALGLKDTGTRRLLTILERGRIRSLGASTFPGVGRNMAKHISLGGHLFTLFEQLEALAFIRLSPDCFLSSKVSPLQTEFGTLDDLWERLAGLVEDQESFGREVLAFLLDTSPEIHVLLKRLATEAQRADPDTTPTMLPEDGLPQEMQPDIEKEQNPHEIKEETLLDHKGVAFDTDYRVYTTAFDRITLAETLFSPEERIFYARKLEQESMSYRRTVTRLARRLMRQIMAWQRRSWIFDQDEGRLDPRRLARLAATPLNHRIFMRETQAPFPATVVSLLLDNSGSMKGQPIQMAAMTVKVLSEALERCGVKTEILGYTTRTWNGGRARKQWQQAGLPSHPGRLNESLHIVYKSADTPWRRARHNLGGMLHPELLKENIDGEALAWAWGRLMNRPEPRRIIIILCDGSPHDEATLEANPPDYLTRHLRDVIGRIEQSPIQVAAIGIRHQVGRFYSQAVFLEKMETLAETLTRQLLHLFDPDAAPGL
ncbi:cobaltochelatase CobT-related protein [Desulfobacter latus]|uniref:VWFA domain-containing protein n=1 Tax=Desulfobacter latus TaxID=2292 RepID=A0A850T549_9BACT|nr:hypothetical protein [Desulfobacter latus]NWH03397.1 hypothetical protein [Desulfobacter latus]